MVDAYFRTKADKILETAKEVLQNLDDAAQAQERAKQAIDRARENIKAADQDLAEVRCRCTLSNSPSPYQGGHYYHMSHWTLTNQGSHFRNALHIVTLKK